MRKMGIDYDSLKAIRGDIILARISTFGPEGPLADRLGFDTIAQAMSGAMSLTGFPGAPVRAVVPYADYGTALHTALGILAALLHRQKTGEGQTVDGSLLATAVTFMQPFLAERHVTGTKRTQQGNAAFYVAPADTYQTSDGWIIVQVIGADMFARWARLAGREDLLSDPRFSDDLSRANNRHAISSAMREWLAGRTTEQALKDLEGARVPAGPVLELDDVLKNEQVIARNLLQYFEYPGAPKPVPLANTAVQFSASPGGIRDQAPQPGEHSSQILAELGYSPDEVLELRRGQVIE
jgi:crotonobetainyl-CoA:carnitine CoA-transferase CaiB-like acyl-CoA transferase